MYLQHFIILAIKFVLQTRGFPGFDHFYKPAPWLGVGARVDSVLAVYAVAGENPNLKFAWFST